VAPIPDLRSRYRQDLLSRTLKRVLDAEDAADALERRLLLAIRGHLAAHPEITAAALRPLRAELDQGLATAVEASRTAPEGAQEEAPRRVAEADAARRDLEALVGRLRTAATVPGAVPPDPEPDLARLGDPATVDIAQERLALLRPFLAPVDQVRVDEAEAAWVTRTRLPALRETLAQAETGAEEGLQEANAEVLSALVDTLETLVEEQRAGVEALPDGEAGSLAAVRKEAASLDLQILETRHRAATTRLQALEAVDSSATTEAQRARVEAEEALAVAEAARREARGQSEIRIAELRTSAAEAHQSAAEAWEAVREMETALDTRSTERHDQLAVLTSRAGEAEVALGLGQEDVDALYRELRDFIGELRGEAAQASGAILGAQDARRKSQADATAARAEIRGARAAGEALAGEELRASWIEALDDEVRALDQAASLVQADRDDALHVLHAAKAVRRGLSSGVSWVEREADRGELLVDLGHELQLMGPTLVAGGRERLRALLGLPGALLDFNFVTGVLQGSFFALLLAVAWWYLRRTTPRFAGYLLTRLRRWDERLRPVQLQKLRRPLEGFLRPVVDFVLGILLLEPLYALLPELGFLLRVYLYLVAYRLALATFELLVLRHPEDRIALVTLAAGTWDLGRRTIRVAVVWWLTRRFASYVLLGLLDADVLDAMVRFAIGLMGLVLLARLLHEWDPVLRARMQRLHDSTVVRFLSRDPPHWSLNFLQSIAILGYFAAAGVSSFVDRLAHEREGLGRLFNVVTRYRLKGEEIAATLRPVPEEVFAELTAEALPQGAYILRDEVDAALVNAVDAWRREQRQGLALLVGDRGAGKRTTVDHFVERGSMGMTPVRVRLGRRLTTQEEVLGGLAKVLDLDDVPGSPEDLAEVLNSRDPAVYILEDMHQAFLRTVNGFDGLRTLLYVLNACGQRHFWLLTMHGPAWQYLSRLTALVNTGVFRSVIELPPMGPDHLQALTLKRMELLGYTADFSPLLRSNPFGVPNRRWSSNAPGTRSSDSWRRHRAGTRRWPWGCSPGA
ncbi:MAG: hypothetical protein JRI25_20045, partial [Deltaproteobacteria bacterium]|nr:hypothetical protein [Deltaproteobacteria bacterium]